MGRKIRLTESAFHSLIRRLVIETKEKMDDEDSDHEDMDNESDYSKMSQEKKKEERAIKKIADYLKSELEPQEKEKLKNKLDESRRYGRYLYEDEEKDLSSRRSGSLGKTIKRGGLALSATGAVAALGSIMGYSEGKLTSMIHDITASAGLGNFTGPVTYAMIAAGLAMALYGRNMEYKKTGK
jgi:hypothetical protein